MIDTVTENVVSISAAARLVPGRPSVRTVWRWTTHGCRGATLETLLIGGRRFTSTEAIARFLHAINAPGAKRISPSTTAKRQREIEQAERELSEAGL